ncbi:MAG: hypothetical protein KDB82_04120 [Planctomycetes bacterium]|nr:hypothetical protein [Planctomycetota bacterium]
MSEVEYLLIPRRYLADLGELQWPPACDAVVDAEGNALVLGVSLAQFIEGAGSGRLVHFGFVLHFLHRMLRDAPPAFEKLQQGWRQGGGSMRNAGALFSELTHALPRVPGHIDLRRLCNLLRQQNNLVEVHWISHSASSPPLGSGAFDDHLQRLLAGLSVDDLRHWFRHGRGRHVDDNAPPIELPTPPQRTLGGELEDALRRKRLAGVAPFIDQMISALTLPPRRVMYTELPVGGYSSVTNRGHPDQILFSEFAVDELEFLRRYAENELLYYQREEPQSQVREDMIVLLDQGVRTWGDARLALSAAAIALGKRAERKGTPVKFAATGNGGAPTDEDIGELIESSDLTPNPGLALERVLEEPALENRDVVLLTHPRALLEDDVRIASRRAPQHVRLFALCIDEDGGAELSELRRGESVSLRRFQLARSRADKPQPQAEAEPDAPWQGPIEPVPLPFRIGLAGSLRHMAMDIEGRHLFTVSDNGYLHAWPLDGSSPVLLPRPLHEDTAQKVIVGSAGVRGGAVFLYAVDGRLAPYFYDTVARRVTRLSDLGPSGEGEVECRYLSDHHCVTVVGKRLGQPGVEIASLDGRSTTEARAQYGEEAGPFAPDLKIVSQPPDQMLVAASSGKPLNARANTLVYQAREGKLALLAENAVWRTWQPRSDGGLLLKDAVVHEAVQSGGTLVMRVNRQGREHVLVFRGPEWNFLGEYNTQNDLRGLVVSRDGRELAFHNKPAGAVGFHVGDTLERTVRTKGGDHHADLAVEIGDAWLTCYGGKFTHLLRWDRERLEIAFLQGQQGIAEFIRRKRDAAALNPKAVVLRPGRAGPCRYDMSRFQRYGYSPRGLLLATDNLGHVCVFDKQEALVAMFFVFRGTVAAWMPDGTRYGPASTTGGPTTPDALGKIGRALREAEAR